MQIMFASMKTPAASKRAETQAEQRLRAAGLTFGIGLLGLALVVALAHAFG